MSEQNESLENGQWSEDELKQMGRLYGKLVNTPATREFTLRATKKIAPETSIPEIDVFDRVGAAMKPHIEKTTKLEQQLLAKDVEAKIEAKRRDLRKGGFNDDEIDAVEKIMVEKQIPDHKTAGEFYRLQSRAATPTPESWKGDNRLPFDKEKTKAAGGFKKFFQQDAHQAVDDLRSGKIKLNS